MRPGSIRYRGRREVASPAFTDHEILALAQGEAGAVIGSHMRLVADKNCESHFNVLRGNIAPTNTAGIEAVVDIGNNRQELSTVFVDLDR
jgi:hypothetical protein